MESMPRIFFLFLSTALAASAAIIPQSGFSGRPGDGTCEDCHPAKSLVANDSLVLVGLPDTLEPETGYSCTLFARYKDLNEWTYELTAVDSLSNQAGCLSIVDSVHTTVDVFLDVQYLKNTLKGAYVNRKDSTSWVFDYVSPTAGAGPVSFYWCAYFKNRARPNYYLIENSVTITLRAAE
jgi:hypothetical protein